MSDLFTNHPAIFIVAIAGVFAVGALVISKFCSFAHREAKTTQSSAYECGFEAVKIDTFVSEKNYAISVYLLLELLFVWLLSCVAICVTHINRCDKYVISLTALLLSFCMVLGARYVLHNKSS
ncbi:MAG: hypothetical protein II670_10070 [Alphaproteobacteria bacterium]|nr:hypothetical protein [Alphaproteobacteria bacterium]